MYTPIPRRFSNAAGKAVSRIAFRLDPPVSPATELAGPVFTLMDTPRSLTDKYAAGRVGGPASRVRLEVNIAAGGWQTLTGAGVAAGGVVGTPQQVQVRGVHLDAAAANSEQVTFGVFVRSDGGEADWFYGEVVVPPAPVGGPGGPGSPIGLLLTLTHA